MTLLQAAQAQWEEAEDLAFDFDHATPEVQAQLWMLVWANYIATGIMAAAAGPGKAARALGAKADDLQLAIRDHAEQMGWTPESGLFYDLDDPPPHVGRPPPPPVEFVTYRRGDPGFEGAEDTLEYITVAPGSEE